jgi:hypothetical protein
MTENPVLTWLLEGDSAIRWQTLRDLVEAGETVVQTERHLLALQGWGARLLSYQEPSGLWAGGLYTPKWTSTPYTILLLRQLGLPPDHLPALKGVVYSWTRAFTAMAASTTLLRSSPVKPV